MVILHFTKKIKSGELIEYCNKIWLRKKFILTSLMPDLLFFHTELLH